MLLGLCLGLYSAWGLPGVGTTTVVTASEPICTQQCRGEATSSAAPSSVELTVKAMTTTENPPDGALVGLGLVVAAILILVGVYRRHSGDEKAAGHAASLDEPGHM